MRMLCCGMRMLLNAQVCRREQSFWAQESSEKVLIPYIAAPHRVESAARLLLMWAVFSLCCRRRIYPLYSLCTMHRWHGTLPKGDLPN